MALQMVGPKDLRAYNVDRDMLWGLPRLFKRLFKELGVVTDEDMVEVFKAHGITPPDGPIQPAMAQVIKDLLAAIVDPFDKAVARPEVKVREGWQKVYDNADPAYVAVRALVSVLFLKGVVCELPLWAEMVRPKHSNDPLPNIDEIEVAAREFLDKLRA